MKDSIVETLIGAVVIAVAVLFFVFAYSSTGAGSVAGGYDVIAKFNRVDGVSNGTDVRMSGIKVGTVSAMSLDPKTFFAVVHMTIAQNVHVPDDSAVKITSEGLLGGQYVSIEPGGSLQNVKPGGEISDTQGTIDLIGLLGKAVFSGGSGGESK